jgi:hypothetical protein
LVKAATRVGFGTGGLELIKVTPESPVYVEFVMTTPMSTFPRSAASEKRAGAWSLRYRRPL